ncbi:hypothetical protein Q2T42_24255 [Leptolyngbya boryana CZ1]|uniref:Uncharacterized protein n=1 Tax=Leptolyngbya boryana CZ1 TaxID=3060204 RepID=A0AA96WRY5_LEPBY|nr:MULTISPECIES: hypothetical protein [Leptolyngbya]MBN8559704.1 hypothetical protein [Leptolyngbya sp. UWPOB_LEPTO1]WNZ44911.1 hypothetical protein Q2T42_24255 [Leptolyngbya boryana CZ1]
MTELKTESQSTRIVQTQPTARRQSKKSAIAAGKESPSEAPAESNTEDIAKKTSRTTKTKKTTQTRQAASKSTNQSASTRVKLTWEPSPSIEASLQQFNEQLNATWMAIDELKATVEQMQIQTARPASVQLPLEPPKAQMSDVTPHQPAQSVPVSRTRARVPETAPQSAIPPFRPTSGFPTSVRVRRRKPFDLLMQSVLRLPVQNSGIAIDAALWVMAAAGLRVGLKYVVMAFPMLELPVMILVFVPALLAAYAALFIPNVNRIGVYRLLLLALGLFVGGRL